LEFLRYSFAVATTVITDVMISVFKRLFVANGLKIGRKLVLLANYHNQSLATFAQLLLSIFRLVASHLSDVRLDELI
jgi:hypothetical protein